MILSHGLACDRCDRLSFTFVVEEAYPQHVGWWAFRAVNHGNVADPIAKHQGMWPT